MAKYYEEAEQYLKNRIKKGEVSNINNIEEKKI